METEKYHIPVLLEELVESLRVKLGEKYIDATIGGGGHTQEILRGGGLVLGIDVDEDAINHLEKRFQKQITEDQLKIERGNFAHLKEIAQKKGFAKVAGIIFDLGLSSHQLATQERGFSFNSEAPLDMRMDPNLSVTAADLINGLNEGELYELFTKLGEERHARPIARAVTFSRTIRPIKTSRQLTDIVLKVRGWWGKVGRVHPATRVFQALRIAVNDELNNLKLALPQASELLKPGGRLIIISFHSLEDRIVKHFFINDQNLAIITKHPIRPSENEIEKNPRSRSAKMRVAEKI